ncbi:MAG: hypothetical protein AB7O48_01010 [Cyclobacteriaceae bacterium]
MDTIKDQLLSRCEAWVGDRLSHLHTELASLKQTLQDETKSSVGDKYETARAMTHLDMEKLSSQLVEAEKMSQVLSKIKSRQANEDNAADLGSLIQTDLEVYFLSISMGNTEIEGKKYVCLSPISPLGKLFMGKRAGELVRFGARSLKIIKIS